MSLLLATGRRSALNRKGKGEYTSRLERARQAAEDYLAHFPRPVSGRGAILRGALVSVYSGESVGSDAAPACRGG